MVDKYNFNVVPNDEQEEFTVDFGETIKVVENDFNQLENRPSYAGTTMTGDTNIPEVPTAVSQLQNDADYQTGSEVSSAINAHNQDEEAHPYIQGIIDTKQDALTAGTNIQISEQNVISATDTTYSAGNGVNINGENAISVDTTVVATQQNLANEVTNRENADNALQAQIDGISASSDVVDIVGTYAELQQYDTQHLKDNDIIKVLQDETQGGATTYYRWSTSTSTFTLIGQEGPYYTKAAADSQFVPQTRTVNGKALSSNITLNASDVSALGNSDVVQTTGSSTSQVMSQNAVTTQLNTKLDASDYVVDTELADSSNPVQNRVINNLLGNMPTDFFTAGETVSGEGTDITLNNTISAPLESVELEGDTYQQTYSGKNIIDNTDLTFDYSNVNSSYTQLSTLPTGIRYKTTYSSSGNPLILFKLPIDLTQYTGKVIRMKANFSGKGRFVISVTNDDLSSRGTAASSSSSGETITWTVPDDLQGKNWLAYSLVIENPGGDYTVDFTDLVITIDNADMSWEPYTGGYNVPSPNPDYPQDVQVVTGEQNVWVHGKNLFNPDASFTFSGDSNITKTIIPTGVRMTCGTTNTSSSAYGFGVFVIGKLSNYIGKKVTLTTNATTSATNKSAVYIGTCNASGGNRSVKISQNGTTGNYSFSISWDVVEDTNQYLCVALYTTLNVAITAGDYVDYKNLQLEIGTATPYEPYVTPQSYTVDLGSTELCKIGTYKDLIYRSGGDWYVHKACGNVVLDGSDDEGWTVASYDRVRTSSIFGLLYNSGSSYGYYANQLTNANSETVDNSFNIGASAIFLKCTSKTSSVANWKTWLSSNNLIIYAPLATPTDTKITDSTLIGQLEALYNAKTYLGTTSFLTTATGTNLPVILDIEAYRKSLAGMLGAIERLSE